MSHDNSSLFPDNLQHEPESATLEGKNKYFGLWFFLGSETVLVASLLGTYLQFNILNAGCTGSVYLFVLDLVFLMTMLLLKSSLTSVYAMYHMRNTNFNKMYLWLGITGLLGIGFLACEIYEFAHYITEYGFTFRSSAFGSAFYAIVGFHGGHVLFGICWLIGLLIRNAKRGLNLYNAPKFNTFSLYWHFIDVVWVFIFTVVYLMGKVG